MYHLECNDPPPTKNPAEAGLKVRLKRLLYADFLAAVALGLRSDVDQIDALGQLEGVLGAEGLLGAPNGELGDQTAAQVDHAHRGVVLYYVGHLDVEGTRAVVA